MIRQMLAAALCCGLSFCALAGPEAQATGPVPRAAMQRLLLTDAERVGKRIVAVGDRGYIVISEDGGKNWRRARAPEAPLITALDFLDEQVGVAVGHDSVILVTRDGGESWTQQFSAPAEQRPLLDTLFLTKDTAVAVGAYGAYYESADAGKTWTARKIVGDDKHLNAVLELGQGHMLILGEAGTILVSTDSGRNWAPVASPYKGSLFGGLVADGGAVVAFGMRGRIFRSTDQGRTWKPVDNASTNSLIGGDKLPDGTLVLAGSAGTALVSGEAGVREVALPSVPK